MAPNYVRPTPAMPEAWTSGAAASTQNMAQANATVPDWRQIIADEPTRKSGGAGAEG
jgi:hypothetical protein